MNFAELQFSQLKVTNCLLHTVSSNNKAVKLITERETRFHIQMFPAVSKPPGSEIWLCSSGKSWDLCAKQCFRTHQFEFCEVSFKAVYSRSDLHSSWAPQKPSHGVMCGINGAKTEKRKTVYVCQTLLHLFISFVCLIIFGPARFIPCPSPSPHHFLFCFITHIFCPHLNFKFVPDSSFFCPTVLFLIIF